MTNTSQSFWIELTIITTRNNPQGKTFLHQNEISYNSEDAIQNGSASCRVRVTAAEIRARIKQ